MKKSNLTKMDLKSGVGASLKKSVLGFARLLKNVTKVGSRLRLVTQKRNRARLDRNVTEVGSRLCSVTPNGYVSQFHNPVSGYAWLHNSVTLPGFRLRIVT